jgi:hypothetical protein
VVVVRVVIAQEVLEEQVQLILVEVAVAALALLVQVVQGVLVV